SGWRAVFDLPHSTRYRRLPLEHQPAHGGDRGQAEERERAEIHQQVDRIVSTIANANTTPAVPMKPGAISDPTRRTLLTKRPQGRARSARSPHLQRLPAKAPGLPRRAAAEETDRHRQTRR